MSAGHDDEGRGKPTATRSPRLTPALVVVAVVTILAAIAAGTAGGWWLQPRVWFDGQSLSGGATPQLMQPPTQLPPTSEAGPLQRWIGAILLGIMLLAVLVGLVYLARWLWRRRPRRAVVLEDAPDSTPAGLVAADPDLPSLLRGADQAEQILTEVGGVPRDLILRCWLALEDAAAASGAARRPSDSPTEFTGTVLHSTNADRASVDTLLGLYHQARFSGHQLTDDDVRMAHSAVVKLARTWRSFDSAMRQTARTDS
jgi:hypothetical protein